MGPLGPTKKLTANRGLIVVSAPIIIQQTTNLLSFLTMATHSYNLRPRNTGVVYAEVVEVKVTRRTLKELKKAALAAKKEARYLAKIEAKIEAKLAKMEAKKAVRDQRFQQKQEALESRVESGPLVLTNGDKLMCGQSKVVMFSGGLLELCRGNQTWSSFKETRKTWSSIQEWSTEIGSFPVRFYGTGKCSLETPVDLPSSDLLSQLQPDLIQFSELLSQLQTDQMRSSELLSQFSESLSQLQTDSAEFTSHLMRSSELLSQLQTDSAEFQTYSAEFTSHLMRSSELLSQLQTDSDRLRYVPDEEERLGTPDLDRQLSETEDTDMSGVMDYDGIPPVAPGVTHATLDAELDAWKRKGGQFVGLEMVTFAPPAELRLLRNCNSAGVASIRIWMRSKWRGWVGWRLNGETKTNRRRWFFG